MPPNTPNRFLPAGNTLRAFVLLIATGLLVLNACDHRPLAASAPNATADHQQDLLIGYNLLANTLSDESRLHSLDVLKTLQIDGTNDAIGKMMTTISDASTRRASELTKLVQLAPNVSDKPSAVSLIGEAITAAAKEIGKSEMTSRDGGFDVRFVLLQAQATRMVAAIATAIERFEPNPERKEWLKSLAVEYEGYRSEMIEYLGEKEEAK